MLIETVVGREEYGMLVVSADQFVELIGSAIPSCTLEASILHREGSLAEGISGAIAIANLREIGHFDANLESALPIDRFPEGEIVFVQGDTSL